MMIYTPIAQGITTNDDSEFTFTDLLTTGDNAYSMENYATAETAQKADTDPEGCFAVAVAADNSATGARVVWVNCPNLLESNINQAVSGGNAQFLGSVVNWMNGEQTTAVISAKSMSAASLSVPTSAASRWAYCSRWCCHRLHHCGRGGLRCAPPQIKENHEKQEIPAACHPCGVVALLGILLAVLTLHGEAETDRRCSCVTLRRMTSTRCPTRATM